MVNDPYKVLGVSETATQDEIKSAYRKLAKKYHPDLHPDDPKASEKMNEINEAYDLLSHPEKYAKRKAEDARRQTYQNYNGNYGYSNQSRSQSSNSNSGYTGGYNGAGGWYSDFGGFDFDDFFNFGGYSSYSNNNINPTAESTDSQQIRNAISYINSGHYSEAARILQNIEHNYRNARWYYLYALCCYGSNDVSGAADYMARAVRMDPNNNLYHSILNKFRSEGQTYYRSSYSETTGLHLFRGIIRIMLIFFLIRIIFSLLFGGFGRNYYYYDYNTPYGGYNYQMPDTGTGSDSDT